MVHREGTLKRYASFCLALVLILGVGTLGPVYGQAGSEGNGIPGASERSRTDGVQAPAADAGTDEYLSQDETLFTFSDSSEEGGTDDASAPVAAFGLGDLLRMVLVLGAVLAAIYGLFWIIRKRRGGRVPQGSILQIKDQVSLGGTRALYLIGLGDRVFMVGATDSSMNLMTEIDDKESLNEIRITSSRRSETVGQNFSAMLSGLLHRAGIQKQDPSREPENHQENREQTFVPGEEQVAFDFMQAQRERLKKW